MKKLLRLDKDIIAGITAAVIAIVLHLLHVVDVDVLFIIVLVLLALLWIRDWRRESHDEHLAESVQRMKASVEEVQMALEPPEDILVGPRHLRAASRRFAETAHGEMVWFNVCFMMFKTQEVIELLLQPAIDNPLVTSIQFVSDQSEKELWEKNMLPKIKQCPGRNKVKEPRWGSLPETVSFILADIEPKGMTEALLSFWGEPFMSRATGKQVIAKTTNSPLTAQPRFNVLIAALPRVQVDTRPLQLVGDTFRWALASRRRR